MRLLIPLRSFLASTALASATVLPLSMGLAATLGVQASAQEEGSAKVDFRKDIQPIFEARCAECHGPQKQKGKLRLDRRDSVLPHDGKEGRIEPGHPEKSLLVELIELPEDDGDAMPPKGERLSKAQIDLIKRWIQAGAEWPADAEGPQANESLGKEELVLAALSGEAELKAQAAIEAVRASGGIALPVASNTAAIDVNWSLRSDAIGDEHLRALDGLQPLLVWLNLARTGVSDGGLKMVAACGELRRLNLSRTNISDAGVKHLAGLAKLEVLNLYGSKVSDACIDSLAALPALKRVYLWQTEVSAEACDRLRAARPNLMVDRGDYVLTEPKPVEASSDNSICPVTGKPVDPSIVHEHEGLKVGFCCEMCRSKFLGDPSAYIETLKENIAATKAKQVKDDAPVNLKCPVSDKDIDAEQFVVHDGKKVAFCCAKCKAAFEKEPEKYLEKLK